MKKQLLFISLIVMLLCVCCFYSSCLHATEQVYEIRIEDHVVYALIPGSGSETADVHYDIVSFFDSEDAMAGVTEITIPAEIDGIPVTTINARSYNDYVPSYHASEVEKIVLPDSIVTIGQYAFNSLHKLKEIEIPKAVTSFGYAAFSYCDALKTVTIPENVQTLGVCCFSNCNNLQTVEILGNSLKTIKKMAFFKDAKLKSIIFSSSLKTIGEQAFSYSGLKTVRVPGNCTVGYCAFQYCKSLKKVVFEDRTDENDMFIQSYAFGYCSKLEKVYLPKESVGFNLLACVFEGCGKLKAVYRTDHIQSIGYHTFYLCKSLTSFTVPAEIQSIHRFAFSDCTGLKKLRVLATDPAFLTAESKSAAFLKKLPKSCKIYVKTEEMKQAFLDAGCKNKVIVKADLK